MKNFHDTIGNRTRDLPAFSAVSAPPRIGIIRILETKQHNDGETCDICTRRTTQFNVALRRVGPTAVAMERQNILQRYILHIIRTCGSIIKRLKKHTDTQMKYYKAVTRPSLLYGSETWVTKQRDMTGLETAEMRFVRSVTGYTRLDKIRCEYIRQELEISGIQDVRLKYK